ncbi:MAG: preprotein translocase subunit SecY [Verrucomicrobiales bacterium]
MISAFANSFKIPELRKRIVFTLLMLVVVQIGAHIPLPGVDPLVVHEWIEFSKEQAIKGQGGAAAFAQLLNVFSGGGIAKCALFALGIMPYISASIMMQLLTAVVPRLSKLAKEEGGRQRITQITRYLAIALCLVQGWMMVGGLLNPSQNILLPLLGEFLDQTKNVLIPHPNLQFHIIAVLTMTAGSMLLMWMGDQITERGVGNGMSLIISANILTALPGALVQVWKTYITGDQDTSLKALGLVLLLALLLAVIAGVVAITQGARRVSIQYAKRQMGRKVVGGQSTYLPLKINYAGVMPIIFAQAIILFPTWILSSLAQGRTWGRQLQDLFSTTSVWYYVLDALLIFFFSYFWVATMFQPTQISEDLKKNGGYIPGVRPGKPTADFLDYTMSRLTFAGAIFLVIIALLPTLISNWAKVPPNVSQFFGGTSLLILVGVLLDMMRQIETHLLKKHYDGFLRKGRIRGRFERQNVGTGIAGANLTWLMVLCAVIVIAAAVFAFSGVGK